MAVGTSITFNEGECILSRDSEINEIFVVLKGKIKAMSTYGEFILSPGYIAGLFDVYYGISIFNYVTCEETLVKSYKVGSVKELREFLMSQPENLGVFSVMSNRFTAKMCERYLELCAESKKVDPSFPTDQIPRWKIEKYSSLAQIQSKTIIDYNTASPSIGIGSIFESAELLCTLNNSLFAMAESLMIDLDYKAPVPEEEVIFALEDNIEEFADEAESDDTSKKDISSIILSDLRDSLSMIISYSGIGEEAARNFRDLLNQYKALPSKEAVTDEARVLRRELTKAFYSLYFEVFKRAVSMYAVPPIILMFLDFGYVDEGLLKKENLIDLYNTSIAIESNASRGNVHTIFNWLKLIYIGEKEPSINSLEITYADDIHQQRKLGKLTPTEEEKALKNKEAKVLFEIQNMFTQASRSASVRPSTFCPILTDEGLPKPLSHLVINYDRIRTATETIKQFDYSAYYREIIFANKECGIEREFIMKEVLPDVILLPQIGSNGIMWQDVEGRKKDSPARFVVPILATTSIQGIMTALTGRFKWEMCKRIQGVYWNNLSEKSLTSEFCDYLQFFKKNHELSDEAKVKVKNQITTCRNNFREVFVKDYELWMAYEVNGNARLNKTSRRIMSKYSPLPLKLRDRIRENPLYTECMARNDRDLKAKENHISLVLQSLKKKGMKPPKELVEYMEFLTK